MECGTVTHEARPPDPVKQPDGTISKPEKCRAGVFLQEDPTAFRAGGSFSGLVGFDVPNAGRRPSENMSTPPNENERNAK